MSLFFTGTHIYVAGRRLPQSEKFYGRDGNTIVFRFALADDEMITVDRFMNGSLLDSLSETFGRLRAAGVARIE